MIKQEVNTTNYFLENNNIVARGLDGGR